jgi:hypothetical protein
MLAEIGIMGGLYIMVRMVSFCTRKGEYREHMLVQILAGLTIVVSFFIVLTS